MRFSTSTLSLAAATAAFLIGTATPAFAQDASAPAAAAPAAAASQPLSKAEQKKQAKAQRKAARKEARAKNNAELKTLEKNGYNPGLSDPNYPQNLQNAQKKAAAAGGASQ